MTLSLPDLNEEYSTSENTSSTTYSTRGHHSKNTADREYLSTLQDILDSGTKTPNRTGTGTTSVFGVQNRYDLQNSFPMLSSKKLYSRAVFGELLFFLNGYTNNNWLEERNIHIWDSWRRPYPAKRDFVGVTQKNKKFDSSQTQTHTMESKNITDTLMKFMQNVVATGDSAGKEVNLASYLAGEWAKLMNACYVKSNEAYADWGAKDYWVDESWHSLEQFTQDVQKLPQWGYKNKNNEDFILSCEYWGGKKFSAETCAWLHKDDVDKSGHIVEIDQYSPVFNSMISDINYAANVYDDLRNSKPRRILVDDDDLGPVYGYQWRNFGGDYLSAGKRALKLDAEFVGVDQILQVLQGIKSDPFSRRHIVSAWNPNKIDEMALPPCHTMFQFHVTPDESGKPWGLSCQLYQRSGDFFLGVPFNIASYAALTQLFAEILGLVPLEFVHTLGDAHVYDNHLEQCREQLQRINVPNSPKLKIHHPTPVEELDLTDPNLFSKYSIESFELLDYNPLPSIKAPVAV